MTDIEIATFLSGPLHPEQEALLRFIGASIVDPHGTAVEDDPPAADAGREWSDAELTQLGKLACARPLDREDRAGSEPGPPRGPGKGCGRGSGLPVEGLPWSRGSVITVSALSALWAVGTWPQFSRLRLGGEAAGP